MEDDRESVSSKIVKYYEKFSQDVNLPNYFRGDVANKIKIRDRTVEKVMETPEFSFGSKNKGCSKRTPAPPVVDNKRKETTHLICIDNQNLENASSTSSVASNRKLEWDSGADIGYDYCQKQKYLQKSLSLPVLSAVIATESDESWLRFTPECVIDENVHIEQQQLPRADNVLSDSTNSHTAPTKKQEQTSTEPVPEFLYHFPESIKKKIGVPVAESTPNDKLSVEMKALSSKKSNDISQKNSEWSIRKQLCVTKPILVDCVQYKQCLSKTVQTYVVTTSIATQTDPVNLELMINNGQVEMIPDNKQSIVYLKYSDSNKETSTRSIGTNTCLSEATISDCRSFEFVNGSKTTSSASNYSYNTNIVSEGAQISTRKIIIIGEKQLSQNLSSDEKSSARNGVSSSNSNKSFVQHGKLKESVVEEQSKNSDINKYTDLLQKLLSSKRFDKVEKRYYVDKIIGKVLDLYVTDGNSSSDTPNSLLRSQHVHQINEPPKINMTYATNNVKNTRNIIDEGKTENQYVNCEETLNYSKVHQEMESANQNNGDNIDSQGLKYQHLRINVPWMPMSKETRLKSTGHFEIRTFTTQILPSPTSRQPQCPHSQFTLLNETAQPDSVTSSSKSTSDTCKNTHNDWKTPKTLSEKLYDERRSQDRGAGDAIQNDIVRFAKKERENQINWIRSEILHLNKLKELLQKNNEYKREDFTKPHVEDMLEHAQSIPVFVATTGNSNNGTRQYKKFEPEKDSLKYCTDDTCPKLTGIKEPTILTTTNKIPHEFNTDKLLSANIPKNCIRRYIFDIPLTEDFHNVNPYEENENERKINVTPFNEVLENTKRGSETKQTMKAQNDKLTQTTLSLESVPSTDQKTSGTSTVSTDSKFDKQIDALSKGTSPNDVYKKSKHEESEQIPKIQKDKPVQVDLALQSVPPMDQRTKTSTTSSLSTDSGSERYTNILLNVCDCCKRNEVQTKLRPLVDELESEHKVILCNPCYAQARGQCYSGYSRHTCNCYTFIKRRTINQIKKTVNELNDLENNFKCLCDRKSMCVCKEKKSIAYTLAFEQSTSDSSDRVKNNRYKKEIRIKIPSTSKIKVNKFNTNDRKGRKHSRDGSDDSEKENFQDDKVLQASDINHNSNNDYKSKKNHHKKKEVHLTLQVCCCCWRRLDKNH